jgi:hypothetical protein
MATSTAVRVAKRCTLLFTAKTGERAEHDQRRLLRYVFRVRVVAAQQAANRAQQMRGKCHQQGVCRTAITRGRRTCDGGQLVRMPDAVPHLRISVKNQVNHSTSRSLTSV